MGDLLAIRSFDAAYGEVPIVRAVSFAVAPGEIVAVLGRNGMGKTTLLRGILGLAPVRNGGLEFGGVDMIGFAPEMIARAGIGYVPAGRGIFGSLSVRENLIMCARNSQSESAPADGRAYLQHLADHVGDVVTRWSGRIDLAPGAPSPTGSLASSPAPSDPASGFERNEGNWTLERVLALFPRLAERLAHGGQNLSGGEQQMLAIGRALMTNPRLLLIDEATEGLAPLVARDIWRTLSEICRTGVAAIIVDRDVRQLARIAGRAIVLFKGQIVFDGRPDMLLKDEDLVQRYIGL
jgi:branched-chain amino acid transport system ATP-binding protein